MSAKTDTYSIALYQLTHPSVDAVTKKQAQDFLWAELVALAATVAALTAENERLRETLTLGLGEQESVIAGLRAENERMRAALTEAIAHVEGKGPPSIRIQGVPRALQIPIAALDRWRAALPSSRETTDGRTDPS